VKNQPVPDKYVERVVARLRSRSRRGLAKYGLTLERKDLTLLDWLQHLQDELLDAANYVEVLKVSTKVKTRKTDKKGKR